MFLSLNVIVRYHKCKYIRLVTVTLTRFLSHYPRKISMGKLVTLEICHIIQEVTLSRVTLSKIHSTDKTLGLKTELYWNLYQATWLL